MKAVAGFVLICVGLALNKVIHAARYRRVRDGDRFFAGIPDEEALAQSSSGLLNALALVPLPLVIAGLVFLVLAIVAANSGWVRYLTLYLLIGLVVMVIQIGTSRDIGTWGVGATVVCQILFWPLVIVHWVTKRI